MIGRGPVCRVAVVGCLIWKSDWAVDNSKQRVGAALIYILASYDAPDNKINVCPKLQNLCCWCRR